MSSANQSWIWSCRKASTKIDRKIILPRVEVVEHPLQRLSAKPNIAADRKSKTIFKKSSDSMDLILDGNDPLSVMQREASRKSSDDWDAVNEATPSKYKNVEPWARRKQAILSSFNSNDILTMTSCFSLQDRAKTDRQEDLEDGIIFEINDITPQEYNRRIDAFHNEIIKLWNEDQRVKALKIVIQCSKLLSDSYNYTFYPTKFVRITEILQTFGDLVYKRLREKCEQSGKSELYGRSMKKFPENFTVDMVPEAAQQTCRNWFYKIASIRELIPRLYVEAALLRSYSFIKNRENGEVLKRLNRMVVGIGDPLVATYLYCYLCRVGLEFGSENYDVFLNNFSGFLEIYHKAFENYKHLRLIMEFPKYLEAFLPAVQWMFEGVIVKVESNDAETIQNNYLTNFASIPDNTLLLYLMLTSAQNTFVATRAVAFLKWISESDYKDVPLHKLLIELGKHLTKYSRDTNFQLPHALLEKVWPMMTQIDNCNDYLLVIDQWLPLSVERLSAKRVDELLNDIIQHLSKETFDDRTYIYLENFIRHLTAGISDFMSLLIIENFLPFINLFRSESIKVTICKTIMEAFVKRSHETFITDTVVLNNLMQIAKVLHDSISALTVEDEKRQISNLITNFVRRIDFGRDFEQQLDFYVEARGAFFNLDAVHATLIHLVNKLSFETLKVVKGRHTTKTSAFVRACAAYCFTTIPSIDSAITRLQLNLISSQTALANQCLGQADAYFKAILDNIADLQKLAEDKMDEKKNSETILTSYVKEFISILLVVPDNPCDEEPLHLVRALVKVLQSHSWDDPTTTRVHLYIEILHMLSVAYQDQYPYHFFNVDSNDVLYASDPTYREEINRICGVLLHQVLQHLHKLNSDGHNKKQSKLAYDLLYCILMKADISSLEMAKLAANLWKLGKRVLVIESSAVEVANYCLRSSLPDSEYAEIYEKLLAKFS